MARYTYPLNLEKDGPFVMLQFVDLPKATRRGGPRPKR